MLNLLKKNSISKKEVFKIKQIFTGSGTKPYVICCCIAYTLVSLVYVFFSQLNIFKEINNKTLLLLFAITVLAVVLMAITDKYPYKTKSGIIIVNILDIFVSICIINIFAKTFKFDPIYIFSILIAASISYFGVSAVLILKDYKDAYLINKKIEKNKLQTGKETEHE